MAAKEILYDTTARDRILAGVNTLVPGSPFPYLSVTPTCR